jgi:hypothetical protein
MSERREAEAARDKIAELMADPHGLILGVGLCRHGEGYGVAVLVRDHIDGVPVSVDISPDPLPFSRCYPSEVTR